MQVDCTPPGSCNGAKQMLRHRVGQLHILRRFRAGSQVSQTDTGNLQEALQKVNADLEEANRELHDLREVWSILIGGQLLFCADSICSA